MSYNFEMPSDLLEELLSCGRVSKDFPLSLVTTFKTGGLADYIFEPFDEESLIKGFSLLSKENIPLYIIGGGSNLLVSDKGLTGVVIRLYDENQRLSITEKGVYARATVSKERFIKEALEAGFGGVEFMAGIPGAIGGGIFMNAGTYMGSFSDILQSVKIVNTEGVVSEIEVSRSLCSYRSMDLPEDSLILGGYFSLPVISQKEREAIKQKIDEIIKDRWKKHPMEYPSAGSVFKNPEGLSSWKLINDCGLKGFSIGGAKVSEKHTNFIINTGAATSSDIYKLIKAIQRAVLEKHSILLETEVRFMGEFDE